VTFILWSVGDATSNELVTRSLEIARSTGMDVGTLSRLEVVRSLEVAGNSSIKLSTLDIIPSKTVPEDQVSRIPGLNRRVIEYVGIHRVSSISFTGRLSTTRETILLG